MAIERKRSMSHQPGTGRRKQSAVTLDLETEHRIQFIGTETNTSYAQVIRDLIQKALPELEHEIWGK